MCIRDSSIARIAATNWQFKIIYFLNHIDVAIFFVISGYLFEFKKEKYYQESKMVYIKNKIKALLFPYLFWSLILAVGIKIANIFMPNLDVYKRQTVTVEFTSAGPVAFAVQKTKTVAKTLSRASRS